MTHPLRPKTHQKETIIAFDTTGFGMASTLNTSDNNLKRSYYGR